MILIIKFLSILIINNLYFDNLSGYSDIIQDNNIFIYLYYSIAFMKYFDIVFKRALISQ